MNELINDFKKAFEKLYDWEKYFSLNKNEYYLGPYSTLDAYYEELTNNEILLCNTLLTKATTGFYTIIKKIELYSNIDLTDCFEKENIKQTIIANDTVNIYFIVKRNNQSALFKLHTGVINYVDDVFPLDFKNVTNALGSNAEIIIHP